MILSFGGFAAFFLEDSSSLSFMTFVRLSRPFRCMREMVDVGRFGPAVSDVPDSCQVVSIVSSGEHLEQRCTYQWSIFQLHELLAQCSQFICDVQSFGMVV